MKRVKRHPLARKVKIADIEDNLQLARMKHPKKSDYARMEKYRHALSELMKK